MRNRSKKVARPTSNVVATETSKNYFPESTYSRPDFGDWLHAALSGAVACRTNVLIEALFDAHAQSTYEGG